MIGKEVCKVFSSMKWNELITLSLRITNIIKEEAIFKIKGGNTYPSRICQTSKHSIWVPNTLITDNSKIGI